MSNVYGQAERHNLVAALTLVLPAERQAALKAQFANSDIVAANERVVLLSPFTPADSTNRWSSPELDADVQDMW